MKSRSFIHREKHSCHIVTSHEMTSVLGDFTCVVPTYKEETLPRTEGQRHQILTLSINSGLASYLSLENLFNFALPPRQRAL